MFLHHMMMDNGSLGLDSYSELFISVPKPAITNPSPPSLFLTPPDWDGAAQLEVLKTR